MGYTPENNPYIPGDPYSYDLAWMVQEVKKAQAVGVAAEDAKNTAIEKAEIASEKADIAISKAEQSEAWAVGRKNNIPVSADEPQYENHSKYWAEQSFESATNAQISAESARDYADNIADPVSGLVTSWLEDNITNPSSPPVDTSLSVGGAAADAAVTGERVRYAIGAIKDASENYAQRLDIQLINGSISNTGVITTGGSRWISDDYFPSDGIISVANNTNNNLFLDYYSESGGVYTFQRYQTVSSGNTTTDIEAGLYIRAYAYSTSATPDQIDIRTYSNLDKINDTECLYTYGGLHVPFQMTRGSIDASGVFDNSQTNRWSVIDFIENKDSYVLCNYTGYHLWIDGYSGNTEADFVGYIDANRNGGITKIPSNFVYFRLTSTISTLENAKNFLIYNYAPALSDLRAELNEKIGLMFDHFYLIGHRGFMSEAPQNTLPSFATAAKNGLSIFECDLQWTSDGIPVICHNDNITSVSDAPAGTKISTSTYADLLNYDFGSWYDPAFTGTKIPTLEQTLQLAKRLGLKITLEIKESNISASHVSTIVDMITGLNMRNNIAFVSFYKDSLVNILTYDPKFTIGYIFNGTGDEDAASTTDGSTVREVITDVMAIQEPDYQLIIYNDYRYITSNGQMPFITSSGAFGAVFTLDDPATLDSIDEDIISCTTNAITPDLLINSYI